MCPLRPQSQCKHSLRASKKEKTPDLSLSFLSLSLSLSFLFAPIFSYILSRYPTMSVSPSSSSGLLLISDRPLDTIFDRLPTVFVPSYAATLGHLTDVAHSYDDLEHQDYVDEQYTRIPEEYIYQFKQLQHQPWRFFYLDLDRLSREIQSLHQFMLLHDNTSIIDQQQTSFIRTLDAELAKVV